MPKVIFPVVAVTAGVPNVNAVLETGVPKVRPPNNGAEVVGAGNKLLAVVVLVVFDPKSKPLDCVCAEVAGVVLNPKLRPVVVAGVEAVPKANVDAGLLEPKGVLVKLKPVAGLEHNELSIFQYIYKKKLHPNFKDENLRFHFIIFVIQNLLENVKQCNYFCPNPKLVLLEVAGVPNVNVDMI